MPGQRLSGPLLNKLSLAHLHYQSMDLSFTASTLAHIPGRELEAPICLSESAMMQAKTLLFGGKL